MNRLYGIRTVSVPVAIVWVLCSSVPSLAASTTTTYSDYLENPQTWVIGNSSIEAAFQLVSGTFRVGWIDDKMSNHAWQPPVSNPSSPVNLTVAGATLDGAASYAVKSYSFSAISSPAAGIRFTIDLTPTSASGLVEFQADVYEGQPFVRYRTLYTNLSAVPVYVTQADMLSWKFQDHGETFNDFYVDQWEWFAVNFTPHETNLSEQMTPVVTQTGAGTLNTAWRAERDSDSHGLAAGWEFDGQTSSSAQDQSGVLTLGAEIANLNHPVGPNETFDVPDAFLGVFDGDWSAGGYSTQLFVDNVLAPPPPDSNFPYAMFDTWGYGQAINEATVKQAASLAAKAGDEVFILDLGWAREIGDWRPDPGKFPSGIKPISDYVHSLGMKFGLHIPFLQAMPDAPVLQNHPDWQADDGGATNYYGSVSLCPSNKPTRDWIISVLNRIIQDYGVDWVTQDGDNMVKICYSTTHTHAAGDGNYANAVDGLDYILKTVQAANPGVVWENNEDGGSMQTFHMVQRYVTSGVTDAVDALTTRQGAYGALYPFPPRYTEKYMPDAPTDTYETRSYMFGGPFILMNQITTWSPDTFSFVQQEVSLFKSIRSAIRGAQIYQLTPRPDGTFDDAMEAYNSQLDEAVIFVYGASASASTIVQPQGLNPNNVYMVRFTQSSDVYVKIGSELMYDGVPVAVQPGSAEVMTVTPASNAQYQKTLPPILPRVRAIIGPQ